MFLRTISPTHVIVAMNYGRESNNPRYGIPRNVVKWCRYLRSNETIPLVSATPSADCNFMSPSYSIDVRAAEKEKYITQN